MVRTPAPGWMLKSAPGTLIPWSVYPVEIPDESQQLICIDTEGKRFCEMPEGEIIKTARFSLVRLGAGARYWLKESP